MKLKTLKQILNMCPNDQVDIEISVKGVGFVDMLGLDYSTDENGNISSVIFNVDNE